MKITCLKCRQPVSSVDVPENTVIRAWIECPECSAKDTSEKDAYNQAVKDIRQAFKNVYCKVIPENLRYQHLDMTQDTYTRVDNIIKSFFKNKGKQ